MQAQIARTEQNQATLTSQQSLQSIQTLLKAGLGCITYLRNLLPVDNFSESYLTSSSSESLSSQPSNNGSFASEDGKRNISGFKIMTVTRGFTEEADKLLDYLEHGIFDALQKQYLRSFIFAIYLDNEDPNNIVEAYTFNFNYHTIPGTSTVIPIMSLDADLAKLSLTGAKKAPDPVSDAMKNGRMPTLGEVKRSIKTLIKNLIQATTQMDALPKRRYATFKLFYHEDTPDDYEPAHFRPGDAKKDRWFFATHDKGEVPEKCSIGSIQTGYHSVDVRVTSVSGYLPSTEDNNAPFLGTTNGYPHAAPTLTPAEELTMRMQQAEIQRQDALERRVVWDGDEGLGDVDADGEDDPECVQGTGTDGKSNSSLGAWRVKGREVELVAPLGVRDENGRIIPCTEEEKGKGADADQCGKIEEAQYAGKQDNVPSRIGQLAQELPRPSGPVLQTQQLEQTQVIESPSAERISPLSSPSPSPSPSPSLTPKVKRHNLRSRRAQLTVDSPPASNTGLTPLPLASSLDPPAESIDTQVVKDLIVNACIADGEDAEMLDIDTQIIPSASSAKDSIQSFSSIVGAARQEAGTVQADSVIEQEQIDTANVGTLECECSVTAEDCDSCMCEGGCKRWFHVWCMGYHSAKDKRVPSNFVCFDCRVRADQNWDLIMVHDLHPRMMARFRDLAIMRRAIKVFETYEPESLSSFTKVIGCDSAVAGQLFKRLETEGFITLKTRESDSLGLMETSVHATKGKGKASGKARQSHRLRTLQKPKYVFVQASINSKAYQDYFDPEPEIEKKLLGLSDLKPRRKSHKKKAVHDMDAEKYWDVS
ncbi:hypothetical protein AcW1_006192 [Taiwanofungus camphoratus]|nr:hypothetical protein AcV5_006510 [Antrodia cinnamomea]KAI0949935.1 hypothetical protein AcV7_008557 [Antrodia cinnamomea]KAI0957976.1 hypothetical protein AcW1_006192 [Antrodia cinnamomea]